MLSLSTTRDIVHVCPWVVMLWTHPLGKILRALTDIYTELERIERSERQRTEHVAASAYAYAGDGVDAEDYTRV